ncbi:hypothetical protein B7Z28_00385 [Candidatus Saccharibacteria bacterium 32-45-3]|nr:MAG: hypothetical protein B7Z28_00385 [Candidatus Saccharibacteria bacterium 32-45-3]
MLVIGLLAYLLFNRSSMGVASNKYQAVFLTNGQVYFGKLSIQNESIWKLSDVYYLQAKNQSTESDNPQDAAAASNSDVELIKLGNEVHGPDDAMFINKDQALFFENIKDDGTVGKSIKNYLDSKKD